MCGIAGIVGVADASVIGAMLGSIRHRGPDDMGSELFGVERGGPAMLGHVRLAIIDLSPAGHQPMSNEDGSLWITFNGEIYNYVALRNELLRCGHIFHSHSDTEVVLHGYEEWGEGCVDRLTGMFAFAVYDTRRRELLLVRDRFGIKPLYYHVSGTQLVFASEIKALLETPDVPRVLDFSSLDLFLTLGYVPGPRTMFRDIQKLQPGHLLRFAKGRVRLRQYWSLPSANVADESFAAQARRLEAILDLSVQDHLVADVPVASFLSGGLDSSVITALMARHMTGGQTLKTYCVGYELSKSRHDERSHAQIVADHIGTEHHEIVCTDKFAVKALPRLIWHMDEPIAEALLPPYASVCELAQRDVKVTLSGEGADEFLYGYRYYALEGLRQTSHVLPAGLRALGRRALTSLGAVDSLRIRALSCCLHDTALDSFLEWSICFRGAERQAIYTGWSRQVLGGFDAQEYLRDIVAPIIPAGPDYAPSLDARWRMVDYILTRTDKLSMAASLEVRVPFLDHRVVELLAQVPARHKIRGLESKRLLREVARPLLPDSITRRRKKPFGAPVDHWLPPLAQRYLTDSALVRDGILDAQSVARRIQAGLSQPDAQSKLWMLVALDLWYRIFIQRDSALLEQVADRSLAEL